MVCYGSAVHLTFRRFVGFNHVRKHALLAGDALCGFDDKEEGNGNWRYSATMNVALSRLCGISCLMIWIPIILTTAHAQHERKLCRTGITLGQRLV